MRRPLLILVLAILAIPSAAAASADKLHGRWQFVAVAVQDMKVQLPPNMSITADFDKTRHTWAVHAKMDEESAQVTGTWRLAGNQLTLSVKGQEAPPMEIAVSDRELKLVLALPEGERYTLIANRVGAPQGGKAPAPPSPKRPPKRPPKRSPHDDRGF